MNPKDQKKREEELGRLLDKEVSELRTILGELEEKGQNSIEAATSIELLEARKRAVMVEIKGAVAEADAQVKAWLSPAMAGAYIAGFNYTDEILKTFDIKLKSGVLTVDILRTVEDFAPHLQVVNLLIGDAYGDIAGGMTGWVRGNERVLSDVMRQQIQSRIAEGRLAGEAARIIKKDVVSIIQKNGLRALLDRGGRQWTLERYSEMVTRTHLIKANNEATLLRMKEYDIDIVQVSTHGATDDLCMPQEGEIYSMSGKSKNYPRAQPEDLPPYHPNCKHSLLPRPDLS